MAKFNFEKKSVGALCEIEGYETIVHVRGGLNKYDDFIVAITDCNNRITNTINYGHMGRFIEAFERDDYEGYEFRQEVNRSFMEAVFDLVKRY